MSALFNLLTSFKGDSGFSLGGGNAAQSTVGNTSTGGGDAFKSLLSGHMSGSESDLQPFDKKALLQYFGQAQSSPERILPGANGVLPMLAEQVRNGQLEIDQLPPGVAAILSQLDGVSEADAHAISSSSGNGLPTLSGMADGILTRLTRLAEQNSDSLSSKMAAHGADLLITDSDVDGNAADLLPGLPELLNSPTPRP